MIGKRVLFIRTKFKNDDSVDEHREYEGEVLDKISTVTRIEGKLWKIDKYLVRLDDGIIADFFCDEARRDMPIKKKLE